MIFKKPSICLLSTTILLISGCGSSNSTTPTQTTTDTPSASSQSSLSTLPEPVETQELIGTRYEAESSDLLGSSSFVIDRMASASKVAIVDAGENNGIEINNVPASESIRISYTSDSSSVITIAINDIEIQEIAISESMAPTTLEANISIALDDKVTVSNMGMEPIKIDYVEFYPQDIALSHWRKSENLGDTGQPQADHIIISPSGDIVSSGGLNYLYQTGATPTSIAIDNAQGIVGFAYNSAGELYIADFAGNQILKHSNTEGTNVLISDISNPAGLAINSHGDIYISQFNDNSNASIVKYSEDSGTREIVTTKTQTNGIIGLTFDQHDNLYAGSWNTGTIYKIDDQDTLSTVGRIPSIFNNGINQVAYASDYVYATAGSPRRIYRANINDGSIEEITPSQLEIPSSSLDNLGGAIALTADSKQLYIAKNNGDFISLSPSEEKYLYVSTLANVGRAVDGMGVTPDGDILLGGDTLSRLSLAGEQSAESLGSYSGLGMDFDADGNLLIANWGDRAIYKKSIDGEVENWVANANYPNSITITDDGYYVAMCGLNFTGNNVVKYDNEGILLDNIVINGSSNSCIAGITHDSTGAIYVSNWNRGTITKIINDKPSTFTTLTNNAGATSNTNHIVFHDGFIYAPSFNFNQIFKIDSAGNFEVFAGTQSNIGIDGKLADADFTSIMNIAVSNNGDALYTAESNGDIKVISSYKLPSQ